MKRNNTQNIIRFSHFTQHSVNEENRTDLLDVRVGLNENTIDTLCHLTRYSLSNSKKLKSSESSLFNSIPSENRGLLFILCVYFNGDIYRLLTFVNV